MFACFTLLFTSSQAATVLDNTSTPMPNTFSFGNGGTFYPQPILPLTITNRYVGKVEFWVAHDTAQTFANVYCNGILLNCSHSNWSFAAGASTLISIDNTNLGWNGTYCSASFGNGNPTNINFDDIPDDTWTPVTLLLNNNYNSTIPYVTARCAIPTSNNGYNSVNVVSFSTGSGWSVATGPDGIPIMQIFDTEGFPILNPAPTPTFTEKFDHAPDYTNNWNLLAQSGGTTINYAPQNLEIQAPAACSSPTTGTNATFISKQAYVGDLDVSFQLNHAGYGRTTVGLWSKDNDTWAAQAILDTDDTAYLNFGSGSSFTEYTYSSAPYMNAWITLRIQVVGSSVNFYADNGTGSQLLKAWPVSVASPPDAYYLAFAVGSVCWKSGPNDTSFRLITATGTPVSAVASAVTPTIDAIAGAVHLQVSVDGGPLQTGPITKSWTIGSVHTISTSTPQQSPGVQYQFGSWSDGGAVSHQVIASSSTTNYTGTFKTLYLLTTIASPPNGGVISPASGTYYPAGSSVTIAATPNPPNVFTSWNSDRDIASPNNPTTTVTMTNPETITANFSPMQVVIVPGILGTKLISPTGAYCSNTSASSCVAWLSNCQIFKAGVSLQIWYKKLFGGGGIPPETVFKALEYNSDSTPITNLALGEAFNLIPDPTGHADFCGTPIWIPDVRQDVLDCNQSPLNYTPPGQSQPMGAPDCTRNINPYGPLRDQLHTAGFMPSTFPYDWRDDPTVAGEKLYSSVTAMARTSHPIAVIAHSMGGLVVREMVRHHPDILSSISNIVTVGTPYGGSVASYLELQGWKALDEKFLSASATKTTGQYWKAPYFLLPQQSFVTDNAQAVSFQSIYQGVYSQTLFPKLPAADSLLPLAYSFWSATQNMKPLPNAYAIVGSGLSTPSGINVIDSAGGIPIEVSPYYTMASGDGTVTADSAQSTSWIPPANYRFLSEEHLLLPSNQDVIDAIVKTLTTGNMPQFPTPSSPLPFIDAEVLSPVDISATSAAGAHVSNGLI